MAWDRESEFERAVAVRARARALLDNTRSPLEATLEEAGWDVDERAAFDVDLEFLTDLGDRLSSLNGDRRAQSLVAQRGLAIAAFVAPLAVLGSCSHDGTELRFVGTPDDLRVCCELDPPHCWKVGTPV